MRNDKNYLTVAIIVLTITKYESTVVVPCCTCVCCCYGCLLLAFFIVSVVVGLNSRLV